MNTANYTPAEVAVVAAEAFTPSISADSSEALISAYVGFLANVVDSTKATYRRALRPFFSFIKEAGAAAPTRKEVVAYKQYLIKRMEKGTYSALTVCSYLNAVRSFFAWAEAENLYPNIAKGIKSPKHTTQFKKQHLEAEKVGELLRNVSSEATPTSVRDYAIINLLIRTGLRTAELVGANIGDISFLGNTRVLWIKGKGHSEKDSYVVLTEKSYSPIRAYLATRPCFTPEEPLFISTSNHRARSEEGTTARLSTRTIRNIARAALDGVGLDDKAFTAHSFRHTTAVGILEAGGSLEDVMAQLRHLSTAPSRIYTESFNRGKQLNKINAALDSLF